MVANERFNRTDTERDRPGPQDSRGEAGCGRGRRRRARRPRCRRSTLVERGYKGKIYLNHGVGEQRFPARGGKDSTAASCRRARCSSPRNCRGSNPAKRPRSGLHQTLRGARRRGQRVGVRLVHLGCGLRLLNADTDRAEGGRSRARRNSAARCAMRSKPRTSLDVTNGVVNMSATDHLGLDQRARVMVEIVNAKWVYQPR